MTGFFVFSSFTACQICSEAKALPPGELTDKIGLSYDVVKTNKYADFGNIMSPFNEDEKSLLQMMITEGYDTFVTRCAEGRHMTKERCV